MLSNNRPPPLSYTHYSKFIKMSTNADIIAEYQDMCMGFGKHNILTFRNVALFQRTWVQWFLRVLRDRINIQLQSNEADDVFLKRGKQFVQYLKATGLHTHYLEQYGHLDDDKKQLQKSLSGIVPRKLDV